MDTLDYRSQICHWGLKDRPGELPLPLLWPWGTENDVLLHAKLKWLRFCCKATAWAVSTFLYKNDFIEVNQKLTLLSKEIVNGDKKLDSSTDRLFVQRSVISPNVQNFWFWIKYILNSNKQLQPASVSAYEAFLPSAVQPDINVTELIMSL